MLYNAFVMNNAVMLVSGVEVSLRPGLHRLCHFSV